MQKFLTAMIIQNDCKNNYKVLNITKSSRKFNCKKNTIEFMAVYAYNKYNKLERNKWYA